MSGPAKRTPEDVRLLVALAQRMIDCRLDLRLSQRELSEKSGVDMKTISRIEGGLIAPNILTLSALAIALDASLDWLVFGTETVSMDEANAKIRFLKENSAEAENFLSKSLLRQAETIKRLEELERIVSVLAEKL